MEETKIAEKKMEEKIIKTEEKKKVKMKSEEPKAEVKTAQNSEIKIEKAETKAEARAEVKKEIKTAAKKEYAIAKGLDLHASKKHCMYICSFIRNKTIDSAIVDLGEVIKMKRAIPFKGEIPHRKGDNIMSGRYPVKVSGMFITILKGLKGNAIANGLDLDKTRIVSGVSNWAARPAKSGGRRFKRTHVVLTAREIASVTKKPEAKKIKVQETKK